MHGLGTIVNCLAILLGCTVGFFLKGGLSKRFEEIIISAVGTSVLFVGLGGALSGLLTINDGSITTQYTMLMILSMICGGILGEALKLEEKLENLGENIHKRLPAKLAGSTFVEGFVTASMVYCIGAMAIVGALEDGLNGNYTILFAKSILDGIISIVFTASLGAGVAFSILPVAIYQGSITLLAQFVKPYLSTVLIAQMSCIGSILIFALGINMLFGKKFKVCSLLPAIIMPILFGLLKQIFPGLPI